MKKLILLIPLLLISHALFAQNDFAIQLHKSNYISNTILPTTNSSSIELKPDNTRFLLTLQKPELIVPSFEFNSDTKSLNHHLFLGLSKTSKLIKGLAHTNSTEVTYRIS